MTMNRRILCLFTLGILCLVSAQTSSAASYDGAIKQARSELRKNPKDKTLKENLAQAYVKVYRETGDKKLRDNAISHYEKIYKAYNQCDQNVRMLYQIMGERALKMGSAGDLKKLRKLIAACSSIMGPGYMPPSMIEYLYSSRTKKLSTEDSIGLLRNSIKESPDYGYSHVVLSGLYRRESQMDLALAIIQNARNRLPDDQLIAWQYGELLLNKLWWRSECYTDNLESLPAAIQALKQAVPLEPNNAGLHAQLGLALRLAGYADLSVFEAQRAYDLDDSPQNIRYLASSLLAQQRSADAFALVSKESHKLIKLTYPDSQTEAPTTETGTHMERLTGIPDNLRNAFIDKDEQKNIAFIADLFAITAQWENASEFLDKMEARGINVDFYTFMRLLNAKKILEGEQAFREKLKRRQFDPEKLWRRPRRLYDYFMGTLTAEAFLKQSETDCEVTEALYHIGIDQLARGHRAKAGEYFAEILEQPTYGYREHISALYLLKQLQNTRPGKR